MEILSGRALVGKVLRGRYRLDAFVGKGGMSWVFRGHDGQTGKTVAVKILLPHLVEEKRVRARFEDEGRYQGRLHHPNIVQVYDVFSDGTVCAIVMEWIVGEDLRDLLKRLRQSIPLTEIWHLMSAILDAMSHAHGHSLIHRDLKPSNILLHEEGLRMVPKVADFGIAKAIDEQDDGLTRTGASLGTLKYMAPEQFLDSKHVDQRADIYSLGVLLFLLLTGRLPFRGDSQVVLYKQMHEGPPSPRSLNPDISEFLESVLLRCLSTMPEQRYASCEELAHALALAVLLEFGVAIEGYERYSLAELRAEVHESLVEMGDATAVGDREGFAVGTMLYQSFMERPHDKESPDGLPQESEGGSGGGLSSVDAFSERSDISSSSGERLPTHRGGLPTVGRSGGIPVITGDSAWNDASDFPPEDLSLQDPTRPLPTRSVMAAFRPPVDPQTFLDTQKAEEDKGDLTSIQNDPSPLSQKTVVQGFVSPFADALNAELQDTPDTPMRREQRAAWASPTGTHPPQEEEPLAFATTLAVSEVVVPPSAWATATHESHLATPSPTPPVISAAEDDWEVRTSQAVDARPPLFIPHSPEQAEAHERLDGNAALEALFRKPERRSLFSQGQGSSPAIATATQATPPSLRTQPAALSGIRPLARGHETAPQAPLPSPSRSLRVGASNPKASNVPNRAQGASVLWWLSLGGVLLVLAGLGGMWWGWGTQDGETVAESAEDTQTALEKKPPKPRGEGFWDDRERPVWIWESTQGRPIMRWKQQRVWIQGKRPPPSGRRAVRSLKKRKKRYSRRKRR